MLVNSAPGPALVALEIYLDGPGCCRHQAWASAPRRRPAPSHGKRAVGTGGSSSAGGASGSVHGLRVTESLADYTVRPTRGADNLFLISRASFSAHSSYAHPVGHHQEVMHTKGKLFETPTTNFSGWYARPIAPYRRPVRAGFQSIQRQGMRISAVTRACTRPR